MIGGSAKRQGQCAECERGQDEVEEAGVLYGELPGQPVLVGIVVVKRCLEADDVWWRGGEGSSGLQQLVWIGNVLGVEH